jgi:hypothetical protein
MAVPATIERWHRVALENLPDEVPLLLANDAVFESPVVHTPQVGKAIVAKYLQSALKLLNTEHFRYGEEWFGERSAVLEFFSEIDGIKINGVDLIAWNDTGLITRFKVMVRPLKAINMLIRKWASC